MSKNMITHYGLTSNGILLHITVVIWKKKSGAKREGTLFRLSRRHLSWDLRADWEHSGDSRRGAGGLAGSIPERGNSTMWEHWERKEWHASGTERSFIWLVWNRMEWLCHIVLLSFRWTHCLSSVLAHAVLYHCGLWDFSKKPAGTFEAVHV